MMRFMIAVFVSMVYVGLAKTSKVSPPLAPSPSGSCSSVIYDMADCISFISEGSTDKKPSPSCCTGFKTVLETNAECICEALKSSAQLGIKVNLTRAAALPSACGVSAPPISKCGVSPAPAPVPGKAPVKPPVPGKPPVKPPAIAPAKPPPSPSDGVPSPNTVPDVPAVPGLPDTPPPAVPPSSDDGEKVTPDSPAPSQSGTCSLSATIFVVVSMLVVSFSYISV